MKKIIIVEPGSGALHVISAVKMLGYEPIILCSINEYSGIAKEYLIENGFYEVDASQVDNIVTCIIENKIIDILGIISTADRFIYQATQAALILNIKGMDPSLLKLNNKAEVFHLIKNDSPPSLIFNKTNIPYEELNHLLKKWKAIVIKPVMSAGAKGLFEINNKQDITNIGYYLKNEKQIKVLDQDWIAQPVLEGTLYSLEGYVAEGIIHFIGISKRTRIKYTETQNEFPVDMKTDPNIVRSLKSVLRKLVKRSGYHNGYFHSEIIYAGERAYLIDANFGRIGGGSIATQVALSNQKTVAEIYSHVISITFFGNDAANQKFYPKEKLNTFAIMYGVDKAEIFREIAVATELKSLHTQFADAGKKLQPVGLNNRSWIGQLVGAPETVKIEIDAICIVTEQSRLKPVY